MQAKLVVAPREVTGKRAARKMRREGLIPGVLYGHEFDSMLLTIDGRTFKALLRQERGMHGLLNLEVEGVKDGEYTVVVKEIQRHPLRDDILHVDFQKIRSDEELTADVSIHFTGEPVGVKEGGILQHYLYQVNVQCLPQNLPQSIEVDISHLALKENLRVHDLPALAGVRYINNPEEIVAAVALKRVRELVTTPEEEALEEAAAEEAMAKEEAATEEGKTEAASREERE